MRWFEDKPKELTEKTLIKDSDFSPFEWVLVNGIWINMYRGWKENNEGILILKD